MPITPQSESMTSLTTPTKGVSGTSTRTLSSVPKSPPNFAETSQLFTSQKRTHPFKVSCQAKDGEQSASRRNLLIGLGGLCGAASLANGPIFYARHCNVNRTSSIWETLGTRRRDLTDPDLLNPSFLFYDENAQLVPVRVGDSLDTTKLGYQYQDVDIPWSNARPRPRLSKAARQLMTLADNQSPRDIFPAKLDQAVKLTVKRPNKKRSKKEKDEQDEILVIQKIALDRDKFVKFDVLINEEDDPKCTPENTEFAGSFANVPHKHDPTKNGKQIETNLTLSLTEILEDLDAEEDEVVLVTLVPRAGCDEVTVGGIKIEFD